MDGPPCFQWFWDLSCCSDRLLRTPGQYLYSADYLSFNTNRKELFSIAIFLLILRPEEWQSGRMRRSWKPLSVYADRGFESLFLRTVYPNRTDTVRFFYLYYLRYKHTKRASIRGHGNTKREATRGNFPGAEVAGYHPNGITTSSNPWKIVYNWMTASYKINFFVIYIF